MMEIVFLVIGLLIGGLIAWLIQSYRFAAKKSVPFEEAEGLKTQLQHLEVENATREERIKNLESDLNSTHKSLSEIQQTEIVLREKLAREETERINSEERIEEQQQEFEKIKEQLKTDFQNLANSILEEKSEKFTKQNKENLDLLLKPFGEKIIEFREKVEKTYETDTSDRIKLREQIKNLTELNVRMSEEATNLTNALKGQSKTMGNWGELVLETLLENSGLIKGEEYLVQESFKTEDGKRSQPDVIINLPDKKHLVIDSKVSLVAYEKYTSSPEHDEKKDKHLKDHITSINNHIKSLSSKSYQDLYQISAPDFVLMFVPLDPALLLALQNNRSLFMDAFDKGVYLVSPATLLFSLRTIAGIWKSEKQNKHAMEIAKRSGDLYDKFVNFYDQLTKLGDYIKKTQECYDDSLNKLRTGKGNLVRRVEVIKQLGARASKSLPPSAFEDEEMLLDYDENVES